MVKIILDGFVPDDHECSCEGHPYGCRNALLEREGNGVGWLVRLHLVERIHLVGYAVRDDGKDGCQVCFAAQEYANGEMHWVLMALCLGSQQHFFRIQIAAA